MHSTLQRDQKNTENLTVLSAAPAFQEIVLEMTGERTTKNSLMAAILYGTLCTQDAYRLNKDGVKIYTAAIAASAVVQGYDEIAEQLVGNKLPNQDEYSTLKSLEASTPIALAKAGIPDDVISAICSGSNIAFIRDMYDAMLNEVPVFKSPNKSFADYLEVATSSNALHVIARMLYLLFSDSVPPGEYLCGKDSAIRRANESIRLCMDIIKRGGDIKDGSPNAVKKYMDHFNVDEDFAVYSLFGMVDRNFIQLRKQLSKSDDPIAAYLVELAYRVSLVAKSGLKI
jgi:hypothetical protein